jgi:hypothetical protein
LLHGDLNNAHCGRPKSAWEEEAKMERKRKRAEEEESTQIEYMQNYPELIVVVGYGV